MNKRVRKIWLAILLAAVMVLLMVPTMAFALRGAFLVSTPDEFLEAVAAVNSGSGEYEISLQSDIDISDNSITDFTANTVTIIGNGHTLSTSHGLGCIGKTTTVNLGKAEGTDTLTLKQNESNCITYAANGAKLNVYEGVTLRDARTIGTAGGIQLNESAECHMYGTIVNCKDEMNNCMGGVMVDGGSTFFMYDGSSIIECTGGVWVQYSQFYMQGGEIKNCTSNDGAGIVLLSSDSILSGGEISGNSAAEYGGGIYLQGSADISDGVKIYNNTATVGGDDIYFTGNYDGNSFLTLGNTPSGLILKATGKTIDGWYLDLPRWTADHAQKYTPVNPISTEVCLKAAHGLNANHGEDEPRPNAPHPNEPADIPQTGDNSRIALWFVMALVSGAVLAGAIIHNKKKESAR